MLSSIFVSLLTLAVTVQGAVLSPKWNDASVKEPKDFRINRLGQGCNAQVIFKRDAKDQQTSYSVIRLPAKSTAIELVQEKISPSAPISARNASAGHDAGAYELTGPDNGYSLLPIHVTACPSSDQLDNDEYKVKAVKPGFPDWFSPAFKVRSATPPDQVTSLKAIRDTKDASLIHLSWEASVNQYSPIAGAFILAKRVDGGDGKEGILSLFVAGKENSASMKVGDSPVYVSVVRYDNGGNGALSNVLISPQVQV